MGVLTHLDEFRQDLDFVQLEFALKSCHCILSDAAPAYLD